MSIPAPEIVVFSSAAAVARAAAERFIALAADAIARRGRFAVALSGGSTPRELYVQLASPAFLSRVDWAHVQVFWGDERAVPPTDAESNYRLAQETLLSRVPIPEEHIHRIPAEKLPQVAAQEYERTLQSFMDSSEPRLDLVLLGLGTNGHTASLFPYTSALREKQKWAADVWVPELGAYRITLTAPVLNAARAVLFLVVGTDKANVVRAVLRGPYDPDRLPAQLVRPDGGELQWFLDADAARQFALP